MDFEKLKADAERFAALHEKEITADLAQLVAVRSARGGPQPDAPFGEGPRTALREGQRIAERLGLETEDCTGVLIARVKGRDRRRVGIIAHVDVVPEGSGWNTDPYAMTERDGWLLGRGVADDKGPAVLALWAAGFFADPQHPPRHGIEVLLGSDEECGMEDLPYYFKEHRPPDFTFTPDGSFPVCNGEKGQYKADFVSGVLDGVLADFSGGVASNVVPDRAEAVVRLDPAGLPAAEGITVTADPLGARIRAKGISAHASMPAGSRSAIGMIAGYLLDNGLVRGSEEKFLTLVRDLAVSHDGAALGIAAAGRQFTPLTVIGGQIMMADGVLTQDLDVRFPPETNGEIIGRALAKRAKEAGAELVHESTDPPFYIEPDSAPILALRETYRAVTGLDDTPFLMGGGTYARHLPNAVSFGIEEPGMQLPPFAGGMHAANEGWPLRSLLRDLVIYICALGRLMDTDL